MYIYIYIYTRNHENNVPSNHHKGLVDPNTLGHMMYSCKLLVNQGVLNKLSTEHNMSGHK